MVSHSLTFGKATILWAETVAFPIAVNHNKLNGDKPLIVVTPITYVFLDTEVTIPAGFGFDGASIPWLFQVLPGYDKIGWHLFADLIHDYSCEFPDKLPRPIGDGIYLALLLSMANAPVNGENLSLAEYQKLCKRRKRQAWLMYKAVSLWTWIQYLRGIGILPKELPGILEKIYGQRD